MDRWSTQQILYCFSVLWSVCDNGVVLWETTGVKKDYDCVADAPADWDSQYDPYRDKNCALPGEETTVQEWLNCGKEGKGKVGLWVMDGATHSPAFNADFSDDMLKFILED